MIRNFKALGLAVVAVLAMSAVVASAAQAVEFKAGAYPAALTAKAESLANGGSQKFVTTAGTVTCDTVTGTATLSGPASSILTTTITYTDSALEAEGKKDTCTGPLGSQPVIEMNGCQYRFNVAGTVDIVCPESKTIVVNGGGLCTVKIGSQTGLSKVTYTTITEGGIEKVTISPAVTNIKYSHSGLCGTGSGTTGSYTGNVIVSGTNSGNPTNVTVA
jgi:hypothetical protein